MMAHEPLHLFGCGQCGELSCVYSIGRAVSKPGESCLTSVDNDGFIANSSFCRLGAVYDELLFKCPHCGTPMWLDINHVGDVNCEDKGGALYILGEQHKGADAVDEKWQALSKAIAKVTEEFKEANVWPMSEAEQLLNTSLRQNHEAHCRLQMWWSYNRSERRTKTISEKQRDNLTRLLEIQPVNTSAERLIKGGILKAIDKVKEAQVLGHAEIDALKKEQSLDTEVNNSRVITVWNRFIETLEEDGDRIVQLIKPNIGSIQIE